MLSCNATHHVVDEIFFDARVAYVDNDLEAVNQSYDLLDREKALSVWPFVSDDKGAYELMACYRDRLASGSYVAMSHILVDEVTDEVKEMMAPIVQAYDETRDPIRLRSREQFTAFFDGWAIVEPGVVYCADWRPVEPVDPDDPIRPWNVAAVACKP